MRNRLRYNKEDITENLFTSGKEWMTTDNQEYIGQYHRYVDGGVYTRGVWDAVLSKRLIPYVASDSNIEIQKNALYKKLKPTIKTKYKAPEYRYLIITEEDRKRGYTYRYFLKRYNGGIIEVDKMQYDEYQNKRIDPNLYTAVRIEWTIVGPINDTYKNGAMNKGIASRNRQSVLIGSKTIPGLETYVTNYIEFATDIDYNVPPDINS